MCSNEDMETALARQPVHQFHTCTTLRFRELGKASPIPNPCQCYREQEYQPEHDHYVASSEACPQ